jgi:hypothetical protein
MLPGIDGSGHRSTGRRMRAECEAWLQSDGTKDARAALATRELAAPDTAVAPATAAARSGERAFSRDS